MASRLNQASETAVTSSNNTIGWHPLCHLAYTRDTWVKLLRSPSDYAAAEAQLLCQTSDCAWVVWIPDHGEAVLDRRDFYCS